MPISEWHEGIQSRHNSVCCEAKNLPQNDQEKKKLSLSFYFEKSNPWIVRVGFIGKFYLYSDAG